MYCEKAATLIRRLDRNRDTLTTYYMLRLSKKCLETTETGKIVNLLSNDVSRFDLISTIFHHLWTVPPQVILIVCLMWTKVGISTLSGVILTIVVMTPFQMYLARKIGTYRQKIAVKTDKRVKLMHELITGIQVIKMYAWEKPFGNVIKLVRNEETDLVTKVLNLKGCVLLYQQFVERSALFLTISTFYFLGNGITAPVVFSLAQFYSHLQLSMAYFYPNAIYTLSETLISLKRIEEFLELEEKPLLHATKSREITLDKVSTMFLKNLTLTIPKGGLCAIVGPVACGKTSLLQLLLQEVPILSGSLQTPEGTMSYASQQPWLFSSTVCNNIVFDQQFNKARYSKVVKACALDKDFQQFPQGDQSLVGERGITLSGGQKARINLARCVYRQAEVYLLDDPLSAVDAHVGKQLFSECIEGFLKESTRVLVTHQLQYLKNADVVVIMDEGRIQAFGTFEELVETNLDFAKLLVRSEDETKKPSIPNLLEVQEYSKSASKVDQMDEISVVDSSPIKHYLRLFGNKFNLIGIVFTLLLSQFSCVLCDLWLTFWTTQESKETIDFQTNQSRPLDSKINVKVIMIVYVALICCIILTNGVKVLWSFKLAMKASKSLHKSMFNAVLKAPMRFFDITPSGSALNRFSNDIGIIDEQLPVGLLEDSQLSLITLSIFLLVILANYYMALPVVAILLAFWKLRTVYLTCAKTVKYLESLVKSPVFSYVNSSLDGLTTIRASRAEEVLRNEFDNLQDVHSCAWALTVTVREAFGMWLDLMVNLFIISAVYGFVVLHQYKMVNHNMVGLALSQMMSLLGLLQYYIKRNAEVVDNLTSVQRVVQYTKLENEEKIAENFSFINQRLSPQGRIQFCKVSLRYSSEADPVLKELTFDIEAGSKIGIVGRTGAGKSSIISAIFRLAPFEGSVLIDGIDSKSLKLDELRKHISIIPQDPVLFSATVRYNLDPFQQFEDWKLIQTLREVELDLSLDFGITEGGSNFSMGQKQLLCLARAILRENKILILDEATANVDPRTDLFIQNTVRRKFANLTVITVAHRLNTIMDSDKILVMDAGRLVEYDHAFKLLENKEGVFSKLVEETGSGMSKLLEETAANNYKF